MKTKERKWMVEYEWTYPCGKEVSPMAMKVGFETKEEALNWANENTTDGTVQWYDVIK